jgi:hypothetical protein
MRRTVSPDAGIESCTTRVRAAPEQGCMSSTPFRTIHTSRLSCISAGSFGLYPKGIAGSSVDGCIHESTQDFCAHERTCRSPICPQQATAGACTRCSVVLPCATLTVCVLSSGFGPGFNDAMSGPENSFKIIRSTITRPFILIAFIVWASWTIYPMRP